jgi:glycosyltransferase involved in cell wall biosynthesis
MGTDKKIQILLSTYNGDKFLKQQIESIFAMEHFSDCCLLIRDDGSTDGTRDILHRYEQFPEVQVEYGENIGVIKSYQWLIRNSYSSCKYFAFCDQDDIWVPKKITIALSALDRLPESRMLLFASRSSITDENLNIIGISIQPVRGISYYNAMVQNVLPGHTQIFNRKLRDSLIEHECDGIHAIDWWLYLVASAMGKVEFSEECTVLHRQHGDNAVGYKLGTIENLNKKLRYIRQGKGNAVSIQLEAFLKTYMKQLPDDYREETEQYLCGLNSVAGRLSYLKKCKLFRQRHSEDLMFRLMYLIGKYNVK